MDDVSNNLPVLLIHQRMITMQFVNIVWRSLKFLKEIIKYIGISVVVFTNYMPEIVFHRLVKSSLIMVLTSCLVHVETIRVF